MIPIFKMLSAAECDSDRRKYYVLVPTTTTRFIAVNRVGANRLVGRLEFAAVKNSNFNLITSINPP